MQSFVRACAAAAVLSMSVSAYAVPVYFQESTGGDLSDGDPLRNFTLDAGQNLIAGNLSLSDYDNFAFTVPAGYQVLGGSLTMTDHDGNITQVEYYFGTGGSANLSSDIADLNVASPSATLLPALGPGVYHLQQVLTSQNQNNSTADWAFTFDVVPEPASLALIGFGPLALLRRRR